MYFTGQLFQGLRWLSPVGRMKKHETVAAWSCGEFSGEYFYDYISLGKEKLKPNTEVCSVRCRVCFVLSKEARLEEHDFLHCIIVLLYLLWLDVKSKGGVKGKLPLLTFQSRAVEEFRGLYLACFWLQREAQEAESGPNPDPGMKSVVVSTLFMQIMWGWRRPLCDPLKQLCRHRRRVGNITNVSIHIHLERHAWGQASALCWKWK